MFRYIAQRPVLKHLIFVLLLSIFLIWMTMFMLKLYTRHGKTIVVPDFSGLTISQADSLVSKHKLRFVIADSIYDNKKTKGTIIMQDPEKGTNVKENRTIYFTIVANMPEQIAVPELRDLTLRQAVSMLETYGLKPGKITYVNSEYKNAVIRATFKGQEIANGEVVKSESKIDLEIGNGLGDNKIIDTTDSTENYE